MKQLTAVAAAALIVVSVLASPAGAARPTLKSLQAQITSLRKDLRATKAKLAVLQKNLVTTTELSAFANAVAVCNVTATADAFQGTWAYLDQVLAPSATPTSFGAQTPLDDRGACANTLHVARTQTVPPSIASFSAILSVLPTRVAPFGSPWWRLP